MYYIDKLGISHFGQWCVPNSLMAASDHYSVVCRGSSVHKDISVRFRAFYIYERQRKQASFAADREVEPVSYSDSSPALRLPFPPLRRRERNGWHLPLIFWDWVFRHICSPGQALPCPAPGPTVTESVSTVMICSACGCAETWVFIWVVIFLKLLIHLSCPFFTFVVLDIFKWLFDNNYPTDTTFFHW